MEDVLLQIPVGHRVAFGRMVFREAIRKYPASRKLLEPICRQFTPEGVMQEISVSFRYHPINFCSFNALFSVGVFVFMVHAMQFEFPTDLTITALLNGDFSISRFLAFGILYLVFLGIIALVIGYWIYGLYVPIVVERIACKMSSKGVMIREGNGWSVRQVHEWWIDWKSIDSLTPVVRTFKGSHSHYLVLDLNDWTLLRGSRISINTNFVLWYSSTDMKIVGECFKKINMLARQYIHKHPLSLPDDCDLDEYLNSQNMGE